MTISYYGSCDRCHTGIDITRAENDHTSLSYCDACQQIIFEEESAIAEKKAAITLKHFMAEFDGDTLEEKVQWILEWICFH